MDERTGLAVAVEVAEIAALPGTIEERAEALIEPLRRVVPFEAIWIALLDPERREHAQLATRGHNEATLRYMASPAMLTDIEAVQLNCSGRSITVNDTPVPKEEVPVWTDHFGPAGFVEGVGIGLFTPDSRYLGLLTMLTDTAAHPSPAERGLIELLAPAIARAVDPMRQISTSARIVCNARAGAALTRGGSALPLPNLPTHAVLRSGSPVLDVVAARVARGAAYTTFLCPVPAGHVRVTALACPDQAPYHLIAAVLVSPAGDLHGLSPGALDILGLLVESWPRRRIAAALGVAEFVVAANIEHIVARLGTGNVALAVLRANREGLYVPRRLVTGRREANGLQSPPPEIPRSHPVDRTLDAIHAHPERRYTLAELAEIAHLSVRRLQDMFRHRTGTSPMRYLETVRLRHAHDDLRRADPATETVSRIAVRNGFPHLGRFAAVYRANYGVPPSETLRAAPGAGPAPGTGSPAPQPLAWLSHPVPTETGWDDMAAVEHPG